MNEEKRASWRSTARRRTPVLVAGGIAVVTVLVVSGFMIPRHQNRVGAQAQIDSASGEIGLPLEAYAMSASELLLVEHANALDQQGCMVTKGLTFPRALQDWSSVQTFPDRRYGLWSKADAETNGYEVPQTTQEQTLAAEEDTFGDDWFQAFFACTDSLTLLPLMGTNFAGEQSVVTRGMNDSYYGLLSSALFADQRSKWETCIQDAELSVAPDSDTLVPVFPPAGTSQQTVAVKDVDCKEDLGTVRVLADWETQTQLDYIDEHQQELNDYRAKVDAVLRQAEAAISSHASN